MNALSVPFRQLVERRLWPLAVLLIAALVAVPMLLSREAEVVPSPTATAPASIAKAALATQPIVTVGDEAARDAGRKVLGARKNPFKPTLKAKKADTTATTVTAPKPAAGSTTTTGPLSTTPVVPVVPKKVYELYSLTVKWGETSSDELKTSNIRRLKAFPASAFPVVIYLGLLEDHKTAVFLVDHDATVQGDGKCVPSPEDCQTLHMKKGDIAFIDAVYQDEQAYQFQLEIVKIKRKKTATTKAFRATAKGGREALRARMSRLGRIRYDAQTGTLRQLSDKAYKAEMSRRSGS